jgi:hypothetical protein
VRVVVHPQIRRAVKIVLSCANLARLQRVQIFKDAIGDLRAASSGGGLRSSIRRPRLKYSQAEALNDIVTGST